MGGGLVMAKRTKTCTCSDRSWYGPEHDTACEMSGPRIEPTTSLRATLAAHEAIAKARSAQNPNTNCLEGMKCPNWQCDEPYGPFVISATIDVYVSDEGTEDGNGEYQWSARSRCQCEHCGFTATIKAFTEPGFVQRKAQEAK